MLISSTSSPIFAFLCVCVCVLFHPLGYVFSSVKITLAPLLLPSYSFESILFPILDLLGICFHCLTPFGFSIKMTIKDFLGPSLRMIERRRRNCGLHGTIPQTIPVEYNRFVLFPLFFSFTFVYWMRFSLTRGTFYTFHLKYVKLDVCCLACCVIGGSTLGGFTTEEGGGCLDFWRRFKWNLTSAFDC